MGTNPLAEVDSVFSPIVTTWAAFYFRILGRQVFFGELTVLALWPPFQKAV
jgi:hypothetical protein